MQRYRDRNEGLLLRALFPECVYSHSRDNRGKQARVVSGEVGSE